MKETFLKPYFAAGSSRKVSLLASSPDNLQHYLPVRKTAQLKSHQHNQLSCLEGSSESPSRELQCREVKASVNNTSTEPVVSVCSAGLLNSWFQAKSDLQGPNRRSTVITTGCLLLQHLGKVGRMNEQGGVFTGLLLVWLFH